MMEKVSVLSTQGRRKGGGVVRTILRARWWGGAREGNVISTEGDSPGMRFSEGNAICTEGDTNQPTPPQPPHPHPHPHRTAICMDGDTIQPTYSALH